MSSVTKGHERRLLAILEQADAPVSLSYLNTLTGLQKTTISGILHEAAEWGKVKVWTEGTQTQTYFRFIYPTPIIDSLKHAKWVHWTPPIEHFSFWGNLRNC